MSSAYLIDHLVVQVIPFNDCCAYAEQDSRPEAL